MADDACQPPVALQGKLKETDKLIQAETSETGRVSQTTWWSHRQLHLLEIRFLLIEVWLKRHCEKFTYWSLWKCEASIFFKSQWQWFKLEWSYLQELWYQWLCGCWLRLLNELCHRSEQKCYPIQSAGLQGSSRSASSIIASFEILKSDRVSWYSTFKTWFQVKVSVFLAYMRSVGLPIAIAIIFLYLLNNVAAIGANLWLSDWSDDIALNGTQDAAHRDMRLGVYGALGLAQGKTFIFLCFRFKFVVPVLNDILNFCTKSEDAFQNPNMKYLIFTLLPLQLIRKQIQYLLKQMSFNTGFIALYYLSFTVGLNWGTKILTNRMK